MATNGHSGHPLKWFKDQNIARQYWECAICLEVLSDPVQVRDCGHQFCALCIDDILKSDPRCPSCRIHISKAMIFEDHAARRMIKQLEVNCCNEGCSWQGCLSSLLQDHQHSCNFLIRSGENTSQLDVGKLEQKLETLMLKVATLEKKHEEDTEQFELKLLKHAEDNRKLTLKYQEDIKELTLKHENEIKEVKLQLTLQRERDVKRVELKLTLQRERDVKRVELKHDEDVRVLRQEIKVLQAIGGAHAPLVPELPLPRQEPEPDYTLKIPNFTIKLAQAKSNNDNGKIESEPFFSSHGYKMKLWVYVNEAPHGYAGYMGIFLILMKSSRDASLPWPFTKRSTFVLVDQQDDLTQRQNIKMDLVPNGQEEFRRPKQRENIGLGYQQFVKHSSLRTRQYIRDHTVYIKVLVEP